jgi:hypothetical protein
MTFSVLAGLLVLFLGILICWYWWGTSSESSVIDVRQTAEKRINELTVNELHDRVQEFLQDEGYTLQEADGDGDYLALRDDETRLVRVDPAARYRDPRRMNQLILQLRRSQAENGVLVTTRPLKEQSRSLARKSSIRIVEPDELLTPDKE